MIAQHQIQTADEIGQYYADLGGYIMAAYPWGEKGTPLEHFDGPEYWVLPLADEISNEVIKRGFNGIDPVDPIYIAVASGNGAAKSTFAGMFNSWIMDTRPMSRVTVTANTGAQLRTKTWPQIDKWKRLALTAEWYEIQSEKIAHRQHPDWVCHAHTWNIGNTQASAGQHARDASSVYIVDEASNVPEQIFLDGFDGGLTDGEPFMLLLGNCKNRWSRLFRAVFGDVKKFYISRSIDTRKCKYTNKSLIEQWRLTRGENSDWFKAHVKGEAPSADELQLISDDVVQEARQRATPEEDANVPLVMGLDFARGGASDNRIVWRRGRNARIKPSIKIPGELTRDTTLMVTKIIQLIDETKPDVVTGDAGNMGGPILDRVRQLKPDLPVIDVMFGAGSPDPRYGNMRAYIWFWLKEWLPGAAIEDSEELQVEMTGPSTYQSGQEGKTYLESKEDMQERGLPDPHWADALVTTAVAPKMLSRQKAAHRKPIVKRPPIRSGRGWMRR